MNLEPLIITNQKAVESVGKDEVVNSVGRWIERLSRKKK
jgi:hypothetical protein